jgi:hypothetical protein
MNVEAASMQARTGALILAVVVLTATLVLAALARAQASPVPGGTVPSTLSLSLGEPSPFKRVGAAGSGNGVYISVIQAEVTATDTPVRLSLADGEATHGPRVGHLAAGSSVLSPALRAQASGGAYRSLDASIPPELKTWGQPLTATPTKIRVRQEAPNARVLRNHHKLLLVTLTAGGP